MAVALLLGWLPLLAQAFPVAAAEGQKGMVSSAQHLATDIGVQMLARGGNAVDAAVAVGYAQAVVNACCGNIGGGGFMLIHQAGGKDIFINFRETAPAAASADMYLDAQGIPVPGDSLNGYRAAAVPGTVLGLDTAHRRYGKLSRATVLAPAIRLAKEGYVLKRGDADLIELARKRLAKDPEAARVFLHADGSARRMGERVVQPDLARTLSLISRQGPDSFYKGATARKIVKAMQAHGGLISAADLAQYTVTESEPIRCTYRGYTVLTPPPPSSGGVTLCEMLNILEGWDLRAAGFHSAESVRMMVEAMRYAYHDRNTALGDPAFVKNPVERLIAKDYAASIRAKISPTRATLSSSLSAEDLPGESDETTHYSVVDRHGMAVSLTYTVNGMFGAAVMVPGTGMLLNNEMDDFTVKPGVPNLFGLVQGKKNAIAPGKRPLSSMAPTIVLDGEQLFMVLGSPGGSRIPTIVLQALVNVIDFDMQPQEAVDSPRFHHQWLPDTIFVEPYGFSADTIRVLNSQGYSVTPQSPWGALELVMPGHLLGAATASSGNDSMAGGLMRPGYLYGAHDSRRSAGSARAE